MIAKIGHGTHLAGALYYNHDKVDRGKAAILFLHRMMETPDNRYNVTHLMRSFEPYLAANHKTEKPALHISLNPDPDDRISNERFIEMAQLYMREMGYGEQPYAVFRHEDIDRPHIHIVSTNVDITGKKISDTYEKRRSMDACRKLEKKFDLKVATEKIRENNEKLFQPVNYTNGNLKSQMASVVRYLPKYYQFGTFGSYNALLSLFNITAEQVAVDNDGKIKQGLVYFVVDEKGTKISNRFKSSLFGKAAGMTALGDHFKTCKMTMSGMDTRLLLKRTVEIAMHSSNSEIEFRKQLTEQGINAVIRRNGEQRIYGVTFIDHNSRSVWNGSQLGKELAANVFNDRWYVHIKSEIQDTSKKVSKESDQHESLIPSEEPHHFFDFSLKTENEESLSGLFAALGDVIPENQGEDFEEIDFAYRIKKNRKRTKR